LGKASAIHAVVNAWVNPGIGVVDDRSQCCWIQVQFGLDSHVLKFGVQHPNDFFRLVVDDGAELFVPQNRHGDDAAVIRRYLPIDMLQMAVPADAVTRCTRKISVKRPAAVGQVGVHHVNADDFFKSF